MLVAAGCGAGAPTSQSLPVAPARGIVLISIDTLRADHLGAYGYHRDTSPFFDALADQGTLYENAIVQYPSTLTSHMSIFTGLFPHEHGVFPPDSVLPEAIDSVTQVLKRAGFRTAGHTEGGFVAGRFGFDRGFDVYTDPDATSEYDVEDTFERGVEFLSTLSPQDRFFLFLHTYAVHDPYTPPADYRSLFFDGEPPADTDSSGRRLRAVNRGTDHIDGLTVEYFVSQYDASIRWVDDELRRFFDQLTALDLRRDTAIIITSDHGEEFLEHGRLAHTQVYPECVRVPLLIIHPELGGARVPHLVQSVDVAPAILELIGLPVWDQPSGSSLLATAHVARGATTHAFAEVIEEEHVRSIFARDAEGRHQLLTAAEPHDPEGTWIARRVSFDVDGGEIDLEVQSFAVPRELRVLVDGRLEKTITIEPRWTSVRLDHGLRGDGHRVTLEVDGCVSPRDLGVGDDDRCLGLQVAGPQLRRFELYDLERDPLAQHDIARTSVGVRQLLSQQLAELTWEPRSQPERRPLTDEERRALEALGYLDPSR